VNFWFLIYNIEFTYIAQLVRPLAVTPEIPGLILQIFLFQVLYSLPGIVEPFIVSSDLFHHYGTALEHGEENH
jgi:hypothetical protein